MLVTFAFRSDLRANFTALNRVYDLGEPLYESDTKQFKIADGITPYTALPYQSTDIATLSATLAAAQQAAADAEQAVIDAQVVAGGITSATNTTPGVVRLATSAEAVAEADDTLAVTPVGLGAALAGLAAPPAASTTVAGLVELATTTEAAAGTDTARAVTAAGVAAAIAALGVATPDATTSLKGKVELATTAEATTGTDSTRAVTPDGLQASINAQAVKLTGAQTIAGVKTFSAAPVVPDSSFTIAKTTGLQAALSALYTKPVGGIPQTDLTAAAQGLLTGAVPATIVDAKGDLLVGSAPDVVIRKPIGTDGQFLVADATAAGGVSWATRDISPAQQAALDLKQDIIPTYATLTAAQAAVTAGTLPDGGLCVIVDPTT